MSLIMLVLLPSSVWMSCLDDKFHEGLLLSDISITQQSPKCKYIVFVEWTHEWMNDYWEIDCNQFYFSFLPKSPQLSYVTFYFFFLERERERTWAGWKKGREEEAEGEGEGKSESESERIPSRLHTQYGRQPRAQSHNPGITTWAKFQSQMLNWLSHPGAPYVTF